MLKRINFVQYRKLKNLSIDFDEGVNIISGVNGTCKTSILHIISNSVQEVKTTDERLIDSSSMRIIRVINSVMNPKIESLTKGDKKYNDPARGVDGTLFSVEYYNHNSLDFRRHNASAGNRYAIKPKYKYAKGESLPSCPVIYLGLSRLVPLGEFHNEDSLVKIKKNLPSQYMQEIADLYKEFTNYEINNLVSESMGEIKNRADFDSVIEGIDSNTISAGEDNLLIILTALVSLKYYYQSINGEKNVCESILLIDEADASLHPAYQIKLLDLFRKYSKSFAMQVVFTTHSITLLEYAMKQNVKVNYFMDNINKADLMPEPDIYKIRMYLSNKTRKDIYASKSIPVFTEDEQARFFIKKIFDYFEETKRDVFCKVRSLFHMVDVCMGSESLKAIFEDSELLRSTIRSICILDGDKTVEKGLNHCIMSLPGRSNPETIAINWTKKLMSDDKNDFWTTNTIIDNGFSKPKIKSEVVDVYDAFEASLIEQQQNSESIKGKRRDFQKRFFENNKDFFSYVYVNWLHDDSNQIEIEKFYNNLKILFNKVAFYNNINPNDWE